MTGLARKTFFYSQKHQECDQKHLYQYIQDLYLLPPNFFLFLGSYTGIGSSLLLIVFSNHTDNPEIHKCRFCLCKGQTFAQSGLKHLQFTPEGLYKLSCFKNQRAPIFPSLENVFVMDNALEHS